MDSLPLSGGIDQSFPVAAELGRLRVFRGQLYGWLVRRTDELFELTHALLCTDAPVKTLVGLCLAPEHRRGHGALYDALTCGSVDVDRLREGLAGLPVPRMFGGRIVLAVDATAWLRPDAECGPQRLFCHVYGRGRRGAKQRLPGWPYQLVVALESGPTSWTAALDVVRLGPADDATAVTADQLRAVVGRLTAAGHWRAGDRPNHGDARRRLRRMPAGVPARRPAGASGRADPRRPGPARPGTTAGQRPARRAASPGTGR